MWVDSSRLCSKSPATSVEEESMLCKVPSSALVMLPEVPQFTFTILGSGEAEAPTGVLGAELVNKETQWLDLLVILHCCNFGCSQDQQGPMSSRKIFENEKLKSNLPFQHCIFSFAERGLFWALLQRWSQRSREVWKLKGSQEQKEMAIWDWFGPEIQNNLEWQSYPNLSGKENVQVL